MVDENDKNSGEELRLLYQITCQDLAQFKQTQWQVSNYGLLLLASIIALAQMVKPISEKEYVVIILLIVGIVIAALACISKLDKSILARRDRLKSIRDRFGASFRSSLATENKEPDSPMISYLLMGSQVVGGAIVFWVVSCGIVA